MSDNKKPNTPKTPTSFFGTPSTTFPQYTSGAWANLPQGTWGPTGQPLPSGPLPPPVVPSAPPGPGGGGLLGHHQGRNGMLQGGWQQYAGQPVSALPQQWQDRMTQRWGLIGGGAPMPTNVNDFMAARTAWRQAHSGAGGNGAMNIGGYRGISQG